MSTSALEHEILVLREQAGEMAEELERTQRDLRQSQHSFKILNIEYQDALKKIDELCKEISEIEKYGPADDPQ